MVRHHPPASTSASMGESACQAAQLVALGLPASRDENLSKLLDVARDTVRLERPTHPVHIGAHSEGLQINGNPIILNNCILVVDSSILADLQPKTNPTADDTSEGARSGGGEEEQRPALRTTPAVVSKEGQIVSRQAYAKKSHHTLELTPTRATIRWVGLESVHCVAALHETRTPLDEASGLDGMPAAATQLLASSRG